MNCSFLEENSFLGRYQSLLCEWFLPGISGRFFKNGAGLLSLDDDFHLDLSGRVKSRKPFHSRASKEIPGPVKEYSLKKFQRCSTHLPPFEPYERYMRQRPPLMAGSLKTVMKADGQRKTGSVSEPACQASKSNKHIAVNVPWRNF